MDSHKEIWTNSCRRIQEVLHADAYSRWIAIMAPVSYTDGVFSLAVDNEFVKTWVEENYLPLIDEALKVELGNDLRKIAFTVDSNMTQIADDPMPAKMAAAHTDAAKRKAAARHRATHHGIELNPEFTFADFIIGPCNSFAHAAAGAVSKNPGTAYNPLFIYGDTGLGKTHLMQAIAHEIRRHNPEASVCYVTSESLLNEYIDALGQNKTGEFRKRYRHVDVLLIDDIHFLGAGNKTALQEEFFHTFNALHNARKQIIMTSDRPIGKIQGLEERLVSRFQWGLVTSIERPNFETRMAILRDKQKSAAVRLPDHLLYFIAENITSNVRQLEGALVRAVSHVSLTKQELTVDVLNNLLKDMIAHDRKPDLSFEMIQKAVTEQFGVRMADMTSKDRPQNIALPRQIAMYLCRSLTRSSLPDIARAFEKTHATILHACKTIRDRMGTDAELKRQVDLVVEKLGRDPSVELHNQ